MGGLCTLCIGVLDMDLGRAYVRSFWEKEFIPGSKCSRCTH